MAFSSVSMANTIAVEEEDTLFKDVIVDCTFEKFKAYNAAIAAGWDRETATWMSFSVFFDCSATSLPKSVTSN